MINRFHKYLATLPNTTIKEVDTDSVTFDYSNLQFLFLTDKDDPNYFRIILPNIAEENDIIHNVIPDIINKYNNNYKVAKLSQVNQSIWISAEQFVYSYENINDLFSRLITLLTLVIQQFRDEYLNN